MGILNRIWSKEANSEDLSLRLAARLQSLSKEQQAAKRDELQSDPRNGILLADPTTPAPDCPLSSMPHEGTPATIRQVSAIANVEETQDQPEQMISGNPCELGVNSEMVDSSLAEEPPEAAADENRGGETREECSEIAHLSPSSKADVPSPTLVGETGEQLERAIQEAAQKVFFEAREQTWSVLGAVNAELRTFREQFGKEIEERISLCDRVTQQALEVQRRVEDTLPRASEVLRSLPLAGEEATAQVQAAVMASTDQLQDSREALSEEFESQKKTLQALAQDCLQKELRLKERTEKFERESAAACDLLGRIAEECFDRLQARANEIDARGRAVAEKLEIEIEQRILSGRLIERATAQIEKAAQAVVKPAPERIWNAGAKAESVADRGVHEVVGRVDTAEPPIAWRLATVMGEKQGLRESSMRGFHHNATVELGNLIDRVVAQSSQRLDERLHSLSKGIFNSADDQVKGMARSTLGTVHEGLEGAFEPSTTQT